MYQLTYYVYVFVHSNYLLEKYGGPDKLKLGLTVQGYSDPSTGGIIGPDAHELYLKALARKWDGILLDQSLPFLPEPGNLARYIYDDARQSMELIKSRAKWAGAYAEYAEEKPEWR